MNSSSTALDRVTLQKLLQAVEPAVLLVPARLLRRVVAGDNGIGGSRFHVPHSFAYWIGRDALLRLADHVDLGLPSGHPLPERVLLMQAPHQTGGPNGAGLLVCWRRLFHAQVDRAIDRLAEEGRLDDAAVRRRVARLGPVVFDGFRAALQGEDLLLPPYDDRSAYREFAALYLELRFFAPEALPSVFPAAFGSDAIDRLLAEDVDAARLFAASRPAGAPDPAAAPLASTEPDDLQAFADGFDAGTAQVEAVEVEDPRRLRERAGRAADRGNNVRAAVLYCRAALVARPEEAGPPRAAAAEQVAELTRRLQRALHLDEPAAQHWRQALAPLLEPASPGTWPMAARLLYDLQTVCVDLERPLYKVDLVEWVLSWGRRPLKRHLTSPREVLVLRHLRSAYRRLARVRLEDGPRADLARLLRQALHRAEDDLRTHMRPVLRAVLLEVGLKPANLPERLSFDKLIEELLDRVIDRGFLTIGDLRDALARNQVKLDDLAGPGEFLGGDPLLQADAKLAVALDGVYRRGEVYLRWLQRFSAAAFGTRVGRWLTLYAILPFVGSFVILEGAQHLLHAVDKGARAVAELFLPPAPRVPISEESEDAADAAEAEAKTVEAAQAHFELVNWWTVLVFGAFLFALVHSPRFRSLVGRGLTGVWRGLKWLVTALPSALWGSPLIRALLENPVSVLIRRYLFVPAAAGLIVGYFFRDYAADWPTTLKGAGAVFLIVGLVYNTRLGRDLEELTLEGLLRAWRVLRVNLLPGLFGLIMEAFRWLLEKTERLLYSVDEWLRFRGGESRLTLVAKAVLGVIWFAITYVVRFCVIVLLEPQVNPIKHFPVVTVSHKLLLPLVPSLGTVIAAAWQMDRLAANSTAFTILGAIPGVFGFLVWELKENWRLYRANRSPVLKPAVIGHHGETMRGLLRPGFHSGTVPKLFAKLRRAERKAAAAGHRRAVHKARLALEHVEKEVRHFVERELVTQLHASRAWGGRPVRLGEVGLEPNRVRVQLLSDGPGGPLWLSFAEQSGRIWAGVAEPGWLAAAGHEARQTFRDALVGLYKRANVDLVHEQVAALLGPDRAYTLRGGALRVWAGPGFGEEVVYPLTAEPLLTPAGDPGAAPLAADDVLLKRRDVAWARWVEVWERDQEGKGHPEPVLPDWRVLPPRAGG